MAGLKRASPPAPARRAAESGRARAPTPAPAPAPTEPPREAADPHDPRPDAAPRSLAGGNPQIPKGDGDGPVQAYIAAMPGFKRELGARVDALVQHLVPGVRKAVRWNTVFYGVEGRGWFMAIHCFTRYVKLSFLNGDTLEPPPPVAAKDPAVRSLHALEGAPLDEAQLARWIAQAASRPGAPVF